MRFLLFYLMADDHPDRVGEAAPRHAAYWQQRARRGYLGGPFADRSGGLITFEADDPAQARQLSPTTRFSARACSATGGSNTGWLR